MGMENTIRSSTRAHSPRLESAAPSVKKTRYSGEASCACATAETRRSSTKVNAFIDLVSVVARRRSVKPRLYVARTLACGKPVDEKWKRCGSVDRKKNFTASV